MTLEVAVNLLWCVPGEVGGSEEYLARQLAGLAEVDPDRSVVSPTLFTTASYPAAHPELAERFATVAAGTDGRRRALRVAVEHTWLATRTRSSQRSPRRPFDLVHHGGGTAPMIGTRPILLTVHDLQFLELPEYVPPRKLRYLRAAVPASVARAAVVATPSEFVRSTVVDAYGVDEERVVVVPHGVPERRTTVDLDEALLRARYTLGDGPVLVYPAITHPHKRHELLLEAMARHWNDPDLRLVLLGGRGTADDQVVRRIVELGLEQRVVKPGRVPDGDRDALLAIADALVFPSRYEGFGAPLVEAMSAGTPVVCGDHPAMREVAGDAAIVLEDDPEAWADVPQRVVRDRERLVVAGHRRRARFTLRTSAAALLSAYERTVG
jgi:glycosyltransferase involved in cell wall biosynthesis